MNTLLQLKIDISPFQKMFDDLLSGLHKVLGFIGFIILAWDLIKIFLYIVKKVLNKTKIDEWSEKLSETKIFGNTTVNVVLTKIIL
ncbi:MAG: hypothetical protein ACI93N_001953 [Flavobacteriaceae bacterium]|jgi:hypothetical protein